MGGGGGLTSLLFFGVMAAILLQVVQGVLSSRSGGALADSSSGGDAGDRVTVVKVQVGLLGSARQLQRDLERIAGRADTSSPAGLHYVLQGGLLRGRDAEEGREGRVPIKQHQVHLGSE